MPGGGWTGRGLDDEMTLTICTRQLALPIMSLVVPEAHQQFQVLILAFFSKNPG
jgi:hypothetical protein